MSARPSHEPPAPTPPPPGEAALDRLFDELVAQLKAAHAALADAAAPPQAGAG